MAFPRFTATLAAILIAACLALATLAVIRYPPYWTQPAAARFVAEPLSFLIAYGLCLLILTGHQPPPVVARIAAATGLLTGGLAILNVTLENLAPARWTGPTISIAFMLLPFLLWTIAAVLATQQTGAIRNGLLTAVLSAALCMTVAVATGFLVELFLRPPSTASLATWPEFLRSHWTDPRAFAIANSFDSAFTHLLFGPITAALFGSIASALALPRRHLAWPR